MFKSYYLLFFFTVSCFGMSCFKQTSENQPLLVKQTKEEQGIDHFTGLPLELHWLIAEYLASNKNKKEAYSAVATLACENKKLNQLYGKLEEFDSQKPRPESLKKIIVQSLQPTEKTSPKEIGLLYMMSLNENNVLKQMKPTDEFLVRLGMLNENDIPKQRNFRDYIFVRPRILDCCIFWCLGTAFFCCETDVDRKLYAQRVYEKYGIENYNMGYSYYSSEIPCALWSDKNTQKYVDEARSGFLCCIPCRVSLGLLEK